MAARPGEAIAQYDAGISSAQAVDVSGGDVNMPRITRGVYIGVSGNLVVLLAGDSANVTLTGLVAGVWHPMQVQKFVQASTTATGILAGF